MTAAANPRALSLFGTSNRDACSRVAGMSSTFSIDACSLSTVVKLEDKDSARLQKVRAAIAGAIVPMTLHLIKRL